MHMYMILWVKQSMLVLLNICIGLEILHCLLIKHSSWLHFHISICMKLHKNSSIYSYKHNPKNIVI